MFQPSQNDVRQFFCETLAKQRQGLPMAPIEVLAAGWIDEHPEYHAELSDLPAALAAVYTVDDGRTNPFLHLSMHLAIEEQLAIDQPPGIRALYEQLRARCETPHHAAHIVMDCLGAVLWQAQRDGTAPDNEAYLECLQRQLK